MITCIQEAWVEQNGEHYIEYYYFCDQCRGTTISPDPAPHCSVRCRQPSDELTRLRALAEAATRLDMPRFCDEHGPKVRECPRAVPLRDTIAALRALEGKHGS